MFGAGLRRRVAVTSYVTTDAGGFVWYISTPGWSKSGITTYPKLPDLKMCQYKMKNQQKPNYKHNRIMYM